MGVIDSLWRAVNSAGSFANSFGVGATSPPVNLTPLEGGAPVTPGDSAPVTSGDNPPVTPGQVVNRSYSNDAGTLDYQLYIPAGDGTDRPLIVMLHGCSQDPSDFAAGTRMNEMADRNNFVVVYPAQSARANGMQCWNWFNKADQLRDQGEPALIAGIVSDVLAACSIDRRRVFVAGLSAGGAMAVILGVTYPELFAAVGVHSGLPYGAAHNMPSAIAAMQGGGAPEGGPGPAAPTAAMTPAAPTIVFHGDRDTTVNAKNGADIVNRAITVAEALHGPLRSDVTEHATANGREYSATVYYGSGENPVIEHWLVHGAGHAWSGGSPNGSFADEAGPDASAEMVRFFLAQNGGMKVA